MKKNYIALVTLFSVCSYAQNGVVSGRIIDGENNFSLPGATIRLENTKYYTISDQSGDYEFLNIPEGTYTVSVEYIGYFTESKEVVIVKNKTTIADFELFTGRGEVLEEIVLMGSSLKGQAKALNQQKNNGNITNIISSDQVGRFPDANVGDALKRVSGVTMQYDQGEARDIIIRGIAPELNSVTLNGNRIPSAEGDNRNVQMDLIPSDMISTIEVNKTLTSDMDADAIGGSVNLITRAVPNKDRFSATISGGYAPIRGKGLYNGSFIYGTRFLDNKLGMVASATWQAQDYGSDNVEAVWAKDDNEKVHLKQMDIRVYDVQRIRRSFSFSTDYKFNQNNRVDFTAMYNWRDDRENRYRVRYRDLKYQADGTYVGEIRRETKGGIDNNRNQNRRLEDQRVLNFALKGEHLLTPMLDMKWNVSYSKASEHRPNERYIDFRQKDVSLNPDLADTNYPFLSAVGGENPGDFKLRKITQSEQYTNEDELGARIDFRTPMSILAGEKGRLRFGARFRVKNKMRDNKFFVYKPIGNLGTLADVENVYLNNPNFNVGNKYVAGFFPTKNFLGNLDLNNEGLFTESLDSAEFLADNYKASEQITAGYVRWDQDLSLNTQIITGIRVEHTGIDYTGNYVLNESELAQQVNSKNSYVNVLPSVTLKQEVNDNFIVRAAVTTSIARPNYFQLAPYVKAAADDAELSAGNPNLKATYATNFDLMTENYFENVGIISGGIFYKKLNNFIYTFRENNFVTKDFAQTFPGLPNPIQAGQNWRFKQSRNGDYVNVYGFEFAFQRQLDFIPINFFKNFGIYANYTYTGSKAKGITNEDGELRQGLGLPRTAPHMLNGSLSWENKKLTMRLSANYTSSYLDQVGGNEFEDVYYDQQFFLDFNASYRIKKQWNIFFEANNLTNQPLRYFQGVSNRLTQVEYYQPRFTFGLKYDM